MATSKPAAEMTPLEYLKRADKEMDIGNGREAAGLMWKAVESTILGLAKDSGMVGDDLDQLASDLDAGSPEGKRRHLSSVVTGVTLLEHSKVEVLEDCELELAYQLSREFVANSR